jgi:MFS family permease
MRTVSPIASLSARLARLGKVDLFSIRGTPVGYHKGMRAFLADSFFTALSDAFYTPYTSLYVLALGGTRTEVGWLASASSFLGMVLPIPGAALTRQWGYRKRMVVVFSALFRLMLLLAALAPLVVRAPAVIWAIIVLLMLRTGLQNTFMPAWLSLTRDIVAPAHRGRYLSSRNLMQAIISMLMIPVAGYVIEYAGAPRGYQVALGVAFVAGIGATCAFSQIPDRRQSTVRGVGLIEQVRGLWRAMTDHRPFLVFVLIRVLFDLGLMVGGPYFVTYQVEVLESPASTIGLLVTLRSFTRMLGLRFWGRLLDKRGPRWVITAACLAIPVLPWIYILASRPWHIAFVDVPSGFLFAGYELAAFALMLELLQGDDNTQAAAGYMTLSSAVSIAGPLIGGWLISTVGYTGDFVASGAIRLAAAILYLLTFRPFGRRRAGDARFGT